jgi:hypothetical protein
MSAKKSCISTTPPLPPVHRDQRTYLELLLHGDALPRRHQREHATRAELLGIKSLMMLCGGGDAGTSEVSVGESDGILAGLATPQH